MKFTVQNTGSRDGVEIAQVYASLPEGSGEPPKRLGLLPYLLLFGLPDFDVSSVDADEGPIAEVDC